MDEKTIDEAKGWTRGEWATAWGITLDYMRMWTDNLRARSNEFPATKLDGDVLRERPKDMIWYYCGNKN